MTLRERLAEILGKPQGQVLPLRHVSLRGWARNADGRPAIVVSLPEGHSVLPQELRGLEIQIDRKIGRPDYLEIASVQRGLTPPYLAVVEHLLQEAAKHHDEAAAVHALLVALDDLREFFAGRRGRLSEAEIRGLYAELRLFQRLLRLGRPAREVAAAWNGPYFNAKDFVFASGHGVEVKSSHRPADVVRISSVEQLEPGDLELAVVVLPLERVHGDGGDALSLCQLAMDVRAEVEHDLEARALFAAALGEIPLDPDAADYDDWRFEEGDWLAFKVEPGFPRVRPNQIEAGVTRVEFSLKLQQLSAFSMDIDGVLEGAIA